MPARKRYFKQLVDILLFHKGKDEENKRERTKVVERIINGQGTHWLSDGGVKRGMWENNKIEKFVE